MAALWSMLRVTHAQCPLDSTSQTKPVLLRLLKDGLRGAVSITVLTRKKWVMKVKTSFCWPREFRPRGDNN